MNGDRSDRRFCERLVRWFRANARPLPWRTEARDPYVALVAEAMAQQTQISRVVEHLPEFLAMFPDIGALASASDDDVRAAWSGMGYYRRATKLRNAARAIVEQFDGVMPRDAAQLRTLPGVGRYTAGAIASIVFDAPEPMVDANVARVLARFAGERLAQGSAALQAFAWRRSAALIKCTDEPGAFNEAIMELGAVVCLPRSPRCDACPLARKCQAYARNEVDEIPTPRAMIKRKTIHHAVVVVRDARQRVLVERRSECGLWAGMWQPPTLERDDRQPRKIDVERFAQPLTLRKWEAFTHATSHRLVRFSVWRVWGARAPSRGETRRFASARSAQWLDRNALLKLALASPHRRILLDAFADHHGVRKAHKIT